MWGIAPLSRENSWSFRSARNARIAHRNPLVMALDGPMKRNSSLVRRQQEEEDDSALRARLKAPTTEDEPSTLPPQYPQTGENESSTSRPGKFKAVSQLVLAMNRFKGVFPAEYHAWNPLLLLFRKGSLGKLASA